jgi:hypothetical protein
MGIMVPNPCVCPYCNSYVTAEAGGRTGQRLKCPRCGESFSYRPGDDDVPVGEAAFNQTALPRDEGGLTPVRWSNRRLATVVLGGMAVMAALGLAFALTTTSLRRSHDRVGSADPQKAVPIKTVPPAELEGLGYLPADTDLVVGVHVAELLQEPAGRELLPRLFTAWPNLSPVNLEKSTGLRLAEVDHVVLAAELQKTLLPRVYLIVQTKTPIDWEQHLRSKLKATRHPEAGHKPWYRIHVEQPPIDPVLWPLNERTLAVCLNVADFKKLRPEQPRGIDQLSAPLQGLIKERMGNAAPLWIAAHLEDWNQPLLQVLLADLRPESRTTLQSVRSLAAWIALTDAATFNAAVECSDASSTERVAAFFSPAGAQAGDLERRFSPANAAFLRELAANWKQNVNGKWFTAQSRATLAGTTDVR